MTLKYLNYVKKWIISYQGKPIAVGDTVYQVLDDAFKVLEIKLNK